MSYDKKKKKYFIQLVMTGVLALVLILTVVNSIKKVKQKKQLGKKKQGALKKRVSLNDKKQFKKKSGKNLSSGQENLFEKLEEQTRELELLRDPFIFGQVRSGSKGERSNLYLKGVLLDKENPQVIINDIIVGIGGRIGVNTVIEIKSDVVILNDGKQNFELRLRQY